MPPNLEAQIQEEQEVEVNDQITIVLTPTSDYSSSSFEINDINLSDDSYTTIDVPIIEEPPTFSIEQSFKDFLIKLTNIEDLSTVTQLKLRVISREVTLQYLSIYTPALRELILDGSVISSLRDLGGGLKNLKILKVNRCGLNCIDGVFDIEQLEELYAADNQITTLAPCAFLINLKVLDVRSNDIKLENMTYLNFCENIEKLYIEGNPQINMNPTIVQNFQQKLSKLKYLNGMLIADIVNNTNEGIENYYIVEQNNINLNNSDQEQRLNFIVDFPPRVVLHRHFNTQ